MKGRRASDWLNASPQGEDARRSERRAQDRRAPRRSIDPLFAATLVNHVAPKTTDYVHGYRAGPSNAPQGRVLNRWA